MRATIPLLDFFRRRKLPVFFTRIVYADDGSDCGVWCEKAPRLRDLIEKDHASVGNFDPAFFLRGGAGEGSALVSK